MPKIIEYPRASFQRVLEMADAIEYLGGKCTVQNCADRLGVKVTGSFNALIGAAKKHGLVDSKKETLLTTELYKRIKLAYDENEKRQNLRFAFLAPPTYSKVYEKFKGRELPIQMLDKLLIREFGVDSERAQRIMNYFIEGAKYCELLIDNKLVDTNNNEVSINDNEDETEEEFVETVNSNSNKSQPELQKNETLQLSASAETYVVHIYGPGMNSKLSISEEEDLIILDAMISKLKKRMNE